MGHISSCFYKVNIVQKQPARTGRKLLAVSRRKKKRCVRASGDVRVVSPAVQTVITPPTNSFYPLVLYVYCTLFLVHVLETSLYALNTSVDLKVKVAWPGVSVTCSHSTSVVAYEGDHRTAHPSLYLPLSTAFIPLALTKSTTMAYG